MGFQGSGSKVLRFVAKGSRDLGFEVSGLGSRAYGFCGSSDSSDVGFRA